MHPISGLCSCFYRCSAPGTLWRVGSVAWGSEGNRSSPLTTSQCQWKRNSLQHKPVLVPHISMSLRQTRPYRRLPTYATLAISTMSNLLYTLTNIVSYYTLELHGSLPHACSPDFQRTPLSPWLVNGSVFAPMFLRLRGKPKKSLAHPWHFHLNGYEIPCG